VSVAARTARALRHPPNWIQLAKFGVVGLSGFAINFAIYDALLGIGARPIAKAREEVGIVFCRPVKFDPIESDGLVLEIPRFD